MKIPARMSVLFIVGALSVGLAFAEEARAGLVPESEPNEPLLAAQNVDSFFTLDFDPNIEDSGGINTSEAVPHVEIVSTGDGTETTDFYSFTVFPGNTVILDIDCGELPDVSCSSLVPIDSWINLYDPNGALFGFNDDGDLSVDTGTTGTLDSFLEVTPPDSGLWTVEVAEWPGDAGIFEDGDYILNVSVGPYAPVSDCCFDHGDGPPGCSHPSCEATVCGLDSFCCISFWDDQCADLAEANCGELCTIPEPGAMLQVGAGLVGLVFLHKHRRRKSRRSQAARHRLRAAS